MKLLSQAEKVLIDAHGMLPLLFFSSHNIVSSRLKGWEENDSEALGGGWGVVIFVLAGIANWAYRWHIVRC